MSKRLPDVFGLIETFWEIIKNSVGSEVQQCELSCVYLLVLSVWLTTACWLQSECYYSRKGNVKIQSKIFVFRAIIFLATAPARALHL